MNTRPFSLAAAGLSLALAVPGLATAQDDAPVLRALTTFGIPELNPVGAASNYLYDFGASETLMRVLDDGVARPWILESLESVDELTWVLTLRQGITFQNGKTVDARAVMDVIEYMLEHSGTAQNAMPEGSSFEITGDYELTLRTAEPFPAVTAALAGDQTFPIFDVEAVRAVEGDWPRLVDAGHLTGPYRLVEHVGEEGFTLERNPDYWQGMPALAGVSVRIVADTNARILAVQNGEVDIAFYPPSSARAVVEQTPGIHFVETPSFGGVLAVMDTSEPPFDDSRVRQALMLAIDYDQIAEEVFGSPERRATGLFPPAVDWSVGAQDTDIEAARALLAEAGWEAGNDGLLVRDGARFAITGLIYPQQPDLVPLTAAIQYQLHQIGIDLQILSVEDIDSVMMEHDPEWDLGFYSTSSLQWGVPDQFLQRFVRTGGDRNFGAYSNAEVDDLIDTLVVTVDTDQRAEILTRIQEILLSEDPYLSTTIFSVGRAVVSEDWQDYRQGPFNAFVTWETAPDSLL